MKYASQLVRAAPAPMQFVLFPKHGEKLGESVRYYRKRARLSQEKLAEKAELSTVFISHIERGVENASVDALARITKALGI